MVENTTNHRSVLERIHARVEARKAARAVEGEQGSLLLDVLIGMAIFALIALIAVSAINGYRQRAYETGAVSDTQGLALEIEANYTDSQTYPTAITGANGSPYAWSITSPAATGNFDQKQSTGNSFACYMNNGTTFVVAIQHKTGGTVDAAALYDSSTGKVTKKRGTVTLDTTACTLS